ncbi:MAG: hypothetical protein FWB74_00290 [Defluviitaleaceae bacterium]|nr:hypothetical protein [Defluviitaleaceae bacterium]
MPTRALDLQRIIPELSEKQLDALYRIAVCFVDERDAFDYLDQGQSDAINRSFAEIEQGKFVGLSSYEDMVAYFGKQLKK